MTCGRSGTSYPLWLFSVRCVQALAVMGCLLSLSAPAWAVDHCPIAVAQVIVVKGQVDLLRRAGGTPIAAVPSGRVCPGDSLKVHLRSQATLLFGDHTALRLDQGTTIAFVAQPDTPVLDLASGALYVISRTPRPFKVRTPFVNANVEGTEFLVEVTRPLETSEDSACTVENRQDATRMDTDRITVYEGRVRAHGNGQSGDVVVGNGQSAIASATSEITVTRWAVRAKDSAAWVLHVPTVVDSSSRSPAIACALKLLAVGRLDEARRKIEQRRDAESLALSSIIALVRNERGEASRLAQEAVSLDPMSATAWMADSYAQQARFRIEAALASARRAHDISHSALAAARLAEVHLAMGNTEVAVAFAEDAARLEPGSARSQTVLGFTQMLRANPDQASRAFDLAITLDPADPLPRLGSGLAKIRRGSLFEGRRDIDTAVWLDPGDSVLRSYLGKAFYEERRGGLAEEQLALAKEFDPNDPTPWFYDGLRKGAENRPAEAVDDLLESIRLNDRRAVYRSQLLLDDDLAARTTSLARIFLELDLSEAALAHAAYSLAVDPGNASAHRFLSDAASTEPRHEITRASELLQAQLRQPLSVTPLQAQLSNDRLFGLRSEGSNAPGFNEFGSLFVANGSNLQLHGVVGSNNTRGEQLIYSGVHDRFGFGLSALQFRTDGTRPNADSKESEGSAFVQWAMTPQTSFQFELARHNGKAGDITSRFDPDTHSLDERDLVQTTDLRLGMRHSFSGSSDLLMVATRHDQIGQFDFGSNFVVAVRETSTRAEIQHLMRNGKFSLVSGLSLFEGSTTEDVAGDVTVSSPRHMNAYTYGTLALQRDSLYLHAGLSYDRMHSRDAGDESQVNPKLGLTWHPGVETTFRAAVFRVLKRRIDSDAGLEPSQVAGFDQYFDDPNGTESHGGAIAADTRLSKTTRAGISLSGRHLAVPLTNFDQSIEFEPAKERLASAYLHWMPSPRVMASIRVSHSRFERPPGATGSEGFALADTTEVPLSVKVFGPGGFWSSIVVTTVRQHGRFATPAFELADGSEHFTVTELVLGYRLPQRRGNASVDCSNLFNKSFRFQDIGLRGARFVPQRTCLFRLSLDF